MADYTDKQIAEFLSAASLGSNKYYAKAVIIGRQLQTENKKLEETVKFLTNYDDDIEGLQAKNKKLMDGLQKIISWSEAYPEVFPEPDLKKAHSVLKSLNGKTLDAISASAMRHVIKGAKEIAEQALKGGE